MRSFTHLCKDTSKQLGRELEQREIDFLYWLHDKHIGNKQVHITNQHKLDNK